MDILYTLAKGANAPVYQTSGSSGSDVEAFLEEDVVLRPFQRAVIPTGLFIQIPKGYEIQVRTRSGNAANRGLVVLNSPGTVDSDYRGEVKVILINLSEESVVIKNGQRIAQLVLTPVIKANFIKTKVLEKSERGSGGFGSSGE